MTRTRTMRRVMLGVCWLALCSTAGTSRADTLTEWKVPFPDSQPYKIVSTGPDVIYVTVEGVQKLGLLDVDRDRITQWTLPYPATSPYKLVWRVGDGTVFMTGFPVGEVGQFDPGTQILRRWQIAPPDSGPWGLGLDGQGRVMFLATDLPNFRTIIGRLDTASGIVTSWLVPDEIGDAGSDLSVLPDGSVFFSVFADDGSGPNAVASLDVATGIFTKWPTTSPGPLMTTDTAGNLYFQESFPDFSAIARLVPSTGALTEWTTPGYYLDDLLFAFGKLFFGNVDPTGLASVDPMQPGSERVLTSFSSAAVTPTTTTISPTSTTLCGDRRHARVARKSITRQQAGAYTLWPIANSPRGVAASGGAIYFSHLFGNTIGRITP